MSGTVKNIFIAESASQPMREIHTAFLVANKGIKSDRYFNQTGKWSGDEYKPDFNLSLIEYENIKPGATVIALD